MVKHPKPVAALFGGSFDPPHRGHEAVVDAVLSTLPVDVVVLEPAWRNPFKTGFYASPQQRLAWVRRLFADNPRVVVDDYEIGQRRSVRTYETLRRLADRYDVRYLVIGADNLADLDRWAHFDELNDTVVWVVATREGHPEIPSRLKRVETLHVAVPVSSTHIRQTGDVSLVPDIIAEEVRNVYTTKGAL